MQIERREIDRNFKFVNIFFSTFLSENLKNLCVYNFLLKIFLIDFIYCVKNRGHLTDSQAENVECLFRNFIKDFFLWDSENGQRHEQATQTTFSVQRRD